MKFCVEPGTPCFDHIAYKGVYFSSKEIYYASGSFKLLRNSLAKEMRMAERRCEHYIKLEDSQSLTPAQERRRDYWMIKHGYLNNLLKNYDLCMKQVFEELEGILKLKVKS